MAVSTIKTSAADLIAQVGVEKKGFWEVHRYVVCDNILSKILSTFFARRLIGNATECLLYLVLFTSAGSSGGFL